MDEDCHKKRLYHRSNIGFGFVSDGEDGPRYTDRPVIADIPLDRIAVVHKAECGQEIQTTYSARGSGYLSAGWADAELAAKKPWADAQASHGKSDNGNHIYVTGQYNFTYRKIFLKDSVSELRPHPEFRQAVANALAVQNDLQRSQEVKRVLNRYGTMFPTAVEMGGKKYSTIKVELDGRTTESSVRREMSLTLGKGFGAAEAGANLGAGAEEISFGWIPFYTVGGAIEAATFTKWRESLESHHQWATIKVLEVESVLSLFDKETQSKIALAVTSGVTEPSVPKIPLYQFRNEAGRHYLGTDPDASKIPVTGDGPWTNQGALGLVFKSPVDDAVPLYHLTSGRQHLYTTSDVEKRSQSGYSDQGIVCYIHTREKPGTIVINRMVNSSWGDNVHAKANEIDEQKRWGYRDEGVRWHTNRQILASIDPSRIAFTARRAADLEILSTSSPISSAYLSAGWSNAKLVAKTPWDEIGVRTSLSYHSDPQKEVYVTGRFSFVHLAVSLTDRVTRLQPHPLLKEDMMNALALDTELERNREVKRVLSWYGTMFPISVEMGGKKHLTIRRPIDGSITESSVKQDMTAALSRSFKAAMHEAEINGDTENKVRETQGSESDPLYFSTVGGLIEASSFTEWKESLASPQNWAVTKVLEVESVLNLFDTDTRLKIALAVFKAPLYQFMNKVGKHCLSIDPDPSKIPATSEGPWFNYGSLGTVLTHPLDGAIPFYHVCKGSRHLFTPHVAERHQHFNEWGFTDQGILCYVHLTHKPGTTPLFRMWNKNLGDNTYVMPNDVEDQKRLGYVIENAYYVYST